MNSELINYTKEGLPVVSLKKFFAGNDIEKNTLINVIKEACQTVGCFCIKDHGVDWSIVENCFKDGELFFHLPVDEKMKYCNEQYLHDDRGYVPFETQNVNAFMGRDGFPNDPVEKLGFGPVDETTIINNKLPPNVYPDTPLTLKDNVIAYYLSLTKLAETLMEIFSSCLSLPESFIYERCNLNIHSIKVNFYPKLSEKPKPGQDRFAEHTDSTPFTILACDEKSKNSLMVRNMVGQWVFANPPPQTFFVNLGDCLARWTNDRWVATPHKVIFPENEENNVERMSLVFFVIMNRQAIIECVPSCLEPGEQPLYEPITVEQFINEKMKNMIDSKVY